MTRLAELLAIRPGEGRLAALVIGLMLITALGSGLGVTGIEALFFARFGVEFLPWLYMGLGTLSFLTSLLITAVLGRVPRQTLYLILPLTLAGLLVAAWAVLGLNLRWFYPVLWLGKEVFNSLIGLLLWGVAGLVCDTRQSKRLFPLFNAGRILGAVLGGFGTGALVAAFGTESLLLAWAATLLAAFVLVRILVVSSQPSATRVRKPRKSARRSPSLVAEMQRGWNFVRRSPLMQWVSGAAILFSILYFSIALPFSRAATEQYLSEEALAGFLGLFNGLSTGAAFLASLFLANRLFARVGIMRAILLLPIIYLIGFGLLAAFPAFAVIVVFRFAQMVWLSGIADAAYQAMFNAVPAERRDQVRAFIGGVPEQAGTLMAGGILIVGEQTMQPQTLYLVGLVAAAFTTFVIWRAAGAYRGALVDALRAGQPQVFEDEARPLGGFRPDATSVQVALAGMTHTEAAVRRVAAEVLGEVSTPPATEALVHALDDSEPTVRVAALRALTRRKASAALLDVAARLQDGEPEVRAQAVEAAHELAGYPAGLTAQVQPLLEDESALVRVRAAVSLLRLGPHERARTTLRGLAMLGETDERVLALNGLAEWGDKDAFVLIANELADVHSPPSVRGAAALALAACGPNAAETLISCLSEENRAVRDAAAKALGRLVPHDGGLGQPVVVLVSQALFVPTSASGALRALEQMPTQAASAPLRRFATERSAAALRDYACGRAVTSPTTEDALRLLADSLHDCAHRAGLQALRALALLGERETYTVAIENLRSREAAQRANALEALETVREAAAVRPLLRVWESSAPTSEATFAPPWPELLNHEDEWVRVCAAWAKQRVSKDEVPMETTTTLPLMERVLFFRRVPLLADLAPADLKQVAALANEVFFADGDYLAEQGELGEEMFIIVSGEVSVQTGEGEVARRQPGDVVGEMALISREPRMASLVARGEVRVLCIDRQSFEGLLRERPETSLAVMRVLCQRLKEATK